MVTSTWRIGFVGAVPGEVRWWQWLLRPGFVHCWAARRLSPGVWLWIEWVPHRLVCNLVTAAHVRRCSVAAAALAVWHAPAEGGERRARRPMLSLHHCATTVAHALGVGLRAPGTPWSLACALRRRGAVLLKTPVAGARGA